MIEEKFDAPKPESESSPDENQAEHEEEDDLFSDCRSDVGSEAGKETRRSSFNPGVVTSASAALPHNLEASIRDRLQLGRGHHHEEHAEEYLQVVVSDPHKVGEGITSYMAYKVLTRTNLHCFRRKSFTVIRRYSDFLGLHEKLVARYQGKGRIIPPAPEKSIIGATRVKIGGQQGDSLASSSHSPTDHPQQCKAHFISRRRAALERFINRVAFHPVLRLDSDFVDFLECDGDLPRASSTAAISSASVFKMFTKVGETVNKMTYKMEEGDAWFEEKTQHVEQMESQLKKLYSILENVVSCRRELAYATGQFAASCSLLASTEEAFHLSRSLEALARTEEKVELSLQAQADADYAYILELVRDYLALVTTVKVKETSLSLS